MGGAESSVYAAGDETACSADSAIPRSGKAGNQNAEFDFEYSGERRNRRKVSGYLRVDRGREHAGAVDAAGICVSAIPGKTAESRAGGFARTGAGESIGRPRRVATGVDGRSDDLADQEEYIRVEDVNVSLDRIKVRKGGPCEPAFFFWRIFFLQSWNPSPNQVRATRRAIHVSCENRRDGRAGWLRSRSSNRRRLPGGLQSGRVQRRAS